MSALNRDEKCVAVALFRGKLHASDGSLFEHLFTSLMNEHNPNFTQVKPQGRKGDRKNDGFDKTTGTYYQCWGPEEITKSIKSGAAKLINDFNGLFVHWNKICPIKIFNFVVNDKFKGTFPDIESALNSLSTAHPNIKFSAVWAKDLEDIFVSLPGSSVEKVLGGLLPDPARISQVRYSSVDHVVRHVVTTFQCVSNKPKFIAPDFGKKISINGLSAWTGSLLSVASYQIHIIDNYFNANSVFLRTDVRDRINQCYLDAKTAISDPDTVFYSILERVCGEESSNKSVQDAGLGVMAYYFEKCDIFEEPSLI